MKKTSVIGLFALLLTTPAIAASNLGYSGGGSIAEYAAIVGQHNRTGELFIIRGRCRSACTMFLSIRNVCIAPDARFAFHAGTTVIATSRMMNSYNDRLRSHLVAVGALQGQSFHYISGRDMIARFGYRACGRS